MSKKNSTPRSPHGQLTPQNEVLTTIGQLTEQGQAWLTKDDILTVRAAVDLRSIITGFVIPAGTVGKILAADRDGMIVDFGLSTVHRLPRNSQLIEVAK
ncbi:MAG: hypothetical protein KDJ65_38880 [Anaerolineae bacterium]|nr:hypothetical protein [Anaerolineae bacterium]